MIESSVCVCCVMCDVCRVGMIEWVQNTKPLKDFFQSALTDNEKKFYM